MGERQSREFVLSLSFLGEQINGKTNGKDIKIGHAQCTHVIRRWKERRSNILLIPVRIFLHIKGRNTLCGAGWYPEKDEKGGEETRGRYDKVKSFGTRRSNWGWFAQRKSRAQNARSKSHLIKWFSAKSRKPSDALWFSVIRYVLEAPLWIFDVDTVTVRIVCVSHYNATACAIRTSASDPRCNIIYRASDKALRVQVVSEILKSGRRCLSTLILRRDTKVTGLIRIKTLFQRSAVQRAIFSVT